ncbi:hypothetical protein N7492_010327 [Penicillium capsulatum]|uniref:Uncharacterized protein n=1 Tax=Penicillium capsulatum TaxID=69766 RepID=A0A9W9LF55_9EURO|nr:hypothetical protein N7492_010327 [Penicillium capsulatum]KAJ6112832.1 hypothetical protein N7512_008156 [Penicillium capsulatum]
MGTLGSAAKRRKTNETPPDQTGERSTNSPRGKAGPQWKPAENHPRWRAGNNPITNIRDVPEGWSPNEPDLYEDDIEGNIARCKDRIQDGVMPQIFEIKLKRYTAMQQAQKAMVASEREELSLEIVRRLDTLKFIEAKLKENDVYEQLPNVQALIKAYRWKHMKWSEEGLCTFWSNGKQISEPEKFDLQKYLQAVRTHEGHKGFWVEGLDGPGLNLMHSCFVQPPLPGLRDWHHMLRFEVRIPGENPDDPADAHRRGHVMEFLEDSGSSAMTLFYDDVEILQELYPQKSRLPALGGYAASTGNGPIHVPSALVQARVVAGKENAPLTRWATITTGMMTAGVASKTPCRVSGVWWRSMLYSGYAPHGDPREGRGNLYVATKRSLLSSAMPAGDHVDVEPPVIVPRDQHGSEILYPNAGRSWPVAWSSVQKKDNPRDLRKRAK